MGGHRGSNITLCDFVTRDRSHHFVTVVTAFHFSCTGGMVQRTYRVRPGLVNVHNETIQPGLVDMLGVFALSAETFGPAAASEFKLWAEYRIAHARLVARGAAISSAHEVTIATGTLDEAVMQTSCGQITIRENYYTGMRSGAILLMPYAAFRARMQVATKSVTYDPRRPFEFGWTPKAVMIGAIVPVEGGGFTGVGEHVGAPWIRTTQLGIEVLHTGLEFHWEQAMLAVKQSVMLNYWVEVTLQFRKRLVDQEVTFQYEPPQVPDPDDTSTYPLWISSNAGDDDIELSDALWVPNLRADSYGQGLLPL